MKKERREEIIGEVRERLRPLLDEKRITQEDVAALLTSYYGEAVDQSTVSRWLLQTTPQPGVMSAILRMLNELRAGTWPPQPGGAAANVRETATEDAANETLDQWGLARAQAVAGLVEMLREDKRILEMRAETALNASRAALLEAEKAPHLGLPLSSDQIEELYRLAEEYGRRVRFGGDDGGTLRDETQPPAPPPPDE